MTKRNETRARATRRAEEPTPAEISAMYERNAKRTSNPKRATKNLYELWNDDTKTAMTATEQYTPDLAIQWALRALTKRKKEGTAPTHATLTMVTPKGTSTAIQGFRRT